MGRLAGLLLLFGCNYGFQGGGGFPSHIQTVYIEAFENETAQFDLEQQIFTALSNELPGQLGLRPAGREVADAVVRGRIVRYDDVAQNYRPNTQTGTTQVLENQVQIGVAIEVLDVKNNVILWESRGVTGLGTYQPSSQDDRAAREEAIKDLITKIIDGAQSQW